MNNSFCENSSTTCEPTNVKLIFASLDAKPHFSESSERNGDEIQLTCATMSGLRNRP